MVRKGFTRGDNQSLALKNEHKFARQRTMPGCEKLVGSDQGLHLARSGAKCRRRDLEWPAGADPEWPGVKLDDSWRAMGSHRSTPAGPA